MADLELLIQTLRSEYRSLDVTIFIFIVYKSWAGGWSDKIHAFFFISILFISIIRLKSGKNKHNLSITKAQFLPQGELKMKETGPELKKL